MGYDMSGLDKSKLKRLNRDGSVPKSNIEIIQKYLIETGQIEKLFKNGGFYFEKQTSFEKKSQITGESNLVVILDVMNFMKENMIFKVFLELNEDLETYRIVKDYEELRDKNNVIKIYDLNYYSLQEDLRKYVLQGFPLYLQREVGSIGLGYRVYQIKL